jgi:large subunit ribosomal protein L23
MLRLKKLQLKQERQQNKMLTIIKPLVNEKSTNLIKEGFFTFHVGKDATKSEVEKLVEKKFGVHVLAVRMVNLKGKKKTQPSRKGWYTTSGMRKAIVKLKKGEKIALFETAEPDKEITVRTVEGEEIAKVKEKKSLLRGTKVKVEKNESDHPTEKMHTQKGGKTTVKGGK